MSHGSKEGEQVRLSRLMSIEVVSICETRGVVHLKHPAHQSTHQPRNATMKSNAPPACEIISSAHNKSSKQDVYLLQLSSCAVVA